MMHRQSVANGAYYDCVDLEMTSELFEEAAGRIRKLGWTQHTIQGDSGERCIIGSLIPEGAPGANFESEVYDLIVAKTGGITPEAFNDAPGRTAEEVIDVLMDCAKTLRNEGR